MNLQALSHVPFGPLVGKPITLKTPDGVEFTAILDRCDTSPRSTMPGSTRTAFSLMLEIAVEEIGDFREGYVMVSADGVEAFGPVYAARILSFKPGMALLEIIFN